ncbi:hypothetical protein L2E82_33182 [Cichorium intybus]|uniref:Uncharacterized protein n=1 Tax=Cichorium intybus TaxID=13427 RepID=A0ACB9BJU0_CICIN|nr:hypothetical protein L2E82_33182 [Cichorium intybus]
MANEASPMEGTLRPFDILSLIRFKNAMIIYFLTLCRHISFFPRPRLESNCKHALFLSSSNSHHTSHDPSL